MLKPHQSNFKDNVST
uniref:Uncharacterized protein n=1 Tax=Anguilla anguilla TaxID=7936 RepID=A0A0E9PE34_ANGAN